MNKQILQPSDDKGIDSSVLKQGVQISMESALTAQLRATITPSRLSQIYNEQQTQDLFTSIFFAWGMFMSTAGLFTGDIPAILLGLVVISTDSNAASLFSRWSILQDGLSDLCRMNLHEAPLAVRSFIRGGVSNFVQSIGKYTQSDQNQTPSDEVKKNI